MIKLATLFALGWTLAACVQTKPTSVSHDIATSPPLTVSYTELNAVAPTTMRRVSLCELMNDLQGAVGLYTVVGLTGKYEEALPGTGRFDAFTYVELELVDAWTATAPKHPVVRTPGGPVPGGTKAWIVRLALGEDVGIHLFDGGPNKGFYHLHPLGVWRYRPDGGMTNGQIHTKSVVGPAELKTEIGLIAGEQGGPCVHDIYPDIDNDSGASGQLSGMKDEGPMNAAEVPLP